MLIQHKKQFREQKFEGINIFYALKKGTRISGLVWYSESYKHM
jgi:hypothetical protein